MSDAISPIGNSVVAAAMEIDFAAAIVAPQLKGMSFERDTLSAVARAEVERALAIWSRRLDLLRAARHALQALVDDGYPTLPIQQIMPASYAELVDNYNAISAALAEFAPAPVATALILTASEPLAR